VGWCEAGRACERRHAWECPDFAESGKCTRKGCRLEHVIRAGADAEEGADALADDALFVRDDAAQFEPEAPAGERKRYLDEEAEAYGSEEEGGLTFRPRKKAKEFGAQKDYIGFGEEDEEGEEEEEEEDEEQHELVATDSEHDESEVEETDDVEESDSSSASSSDDDAAL
jgi:hypothetical protein